MITADFFPGRKGQPGILDIAEIVEGRRTVFRTVTVGDKREARRVAADYSAQPWNF